MEHVASLLFGVLALAAPLTAQHPADATLSLEPAVTPGYAGSFSPKHGWLDGNLRTARIGTRLVVNNSNLSNYYSIPGTGQEWVDNNKLYDLSTDHCEQANGIEFLYCSSDPNPNGVAMILNVYDESIYCAGPPQWPIADCSYSIPNLPGAANGALACWMVTVDLYGVECNLTSDPAQQRRMGWGQVWDNDLTGPWIANGGYGQTSSFTWFDTFASNGNAFLGCYWFGSGPWLGFHFKLFGGPVDTTRYWAEDLGGASTSFDNGLLDVDVEVKNGNHVTFHLADSDGIGFDSMKLLHSTKAPNRPISHRGGNVLIDLSDVFQRSVGAIHQTYTVPPVVGDYYTQAACFRGGQLVGFSNGLRHQAL